MPFYDYVCQACGRRIEVMHGVHATGPERCDACGGRMQRVISRPAIHFKGSGWAKMDARVSSASGGRGQSRAARAATLRAREDTPAAEGASKDETPANAAASGAGTDGAKPRQGWAPSAGRSRSRDEA